MTTSTKSAPKTVRRGVHVTPEPVKAEVTDDTLSVDLADGRTIAAPLAWFPRLLHGSRRERSNLTLSYSGIHWADLNEDVSVEGLLRGEGSGESVDSLDRWLARRARGEPEVIAMRPLPKGANVTADSQIAKQVKKTKRKSATR